MCTTKVICILWWLTSLTCLFVCLQSGWFLFLLLSGGLQAGSSSSVTKSSAEVPEPREQLLNCSFANHAVTQACTTMSTSTQIFEHNDLHHTREASRCPHTHIIIIWSPSSSLKQPWRHLSSQRSTSSTAQQGATLIAYLGSASCMAASDMTSTWLAYTAAAQVDFVCMEYDCICMHGVNL
jgi:hypothetical protein